MDKTEIAKMVRDIENDIRLYQKEFGSFITFNPDSEASKLADTKFKLLQILENIGG